MATMDNLDIQIMSNADNAVAALNKLASTLQRFSQVKQSIEPVTGETKKMEGSFVAAEKKVRNFNASLKKCASSANTFKKAVGGIASGAKTLGSGLMSTVKGFSAFPKLIGGSLVGGVEKAIGSFGRLFSAIQRIAFYRAIRSAIKYITAGFKEGLENLYSWSNAADKRFSSAMDNIATSSLYVKNSLAAMAAPLINALAPAIDFITDKLVGMFNLVNQFFAKLTGQKSYTVAKRIATTWGDASDKVADTTKNAAHNTSEAVKELKKTILAFDEINKLEKESNPVGGGSGGGGGSSGGNGGGGIVTSNMFENKAITDGMNDLMKKLKDVWGVFQKAWAQEGAATIEAANRAFESFKGVLSDIGNTFYRVFTSGYGFDWVVSGLHVLQSMLGIITSINNAFRAAWNDDNKGFNYVASIFTMLTQVNELIASVGKSFSEAFDNGIGIQIWENLIDIATNFNNIIGNLASSINDAWTTSAHGTLIWAAVLVVVNAVLETVNKVTKAVSDWAADLNFEPIMAAFEDLLNAINPLVDTIGDALLWAYENVLLPIGKWSIEAGLPAAIGLLGAAFGLLNSVLNALKEPALYIWDNFLKPVGEWVADNAINAINGLTSALNKVSEWIDAHKESINTVTKYVGGFLGAWLGATGVEAVIGGIATVVTNLGAALPALASGFNPVTLAIMGVIIAGQWLISHWELVKAAWESVKTKFAEIGDAIGEKVGELKDKVTGMWLDFQQFTANIGEGLTNGVETLKTTLSTTWDAVKTGASEVWKWLKDGLGGLASWVKTSFAQSWRTAWNSVVTTFGNLFAKIKDKVKGPINAVIGFINAMIDKIEGAINTIVNGINSALSIHIPAIGFYDLWGNWRGTPEWSWSANLPTVSWNRIDKLASGGILTQPTYLRPNVLAGESGKEAVLPLDQNTEWMDVLAAKVSGNADNNYMLAEYVRAGVEGATARQNELLREQNNILRQLLDKPMTAEVSTSGIINGLIRKNLRDGTTIVPVNG